MKIGRLATGVLLLPQHEPRLLAKQLASLDYVSGGRLMVGIGVGNMEIEARAMGVDMHDRGKRATEYLEVMLALWSEPHPSFAGSYVSSVDSSSGLMVAWMPILARSAARTCARLANSATEPVVE
jgi:alkanesulfonate monooxygenase SsuD/methylene tetrahydromethanopterin reductase-like flavin-dependent oxidoreductase (luciferase family)